MMRRFIGGPADGRWIDVGDQCPVMYYVHIPCPLPRLESRISHTTIDEPARIPIAAYRRTLRVDGEEVYQLHSISQS